MKIGSEIFFAMMRSEDAGTFDPQILQRFAFALFLFVIWLVCIFGAFYLIHFLLTLPMQRAERGRLFLDLIETPINRGQSVEQAIVSISQCGERTVGVRFHLLAAHIESGLSLGSALEKVPRFLPPQISSMLLVGEKLGDLKRVLPACRELLRDRSAGVQSAVHYMLLLVFFFSPAAVGIMTILMTNVFPKMKAVFGGIMAGAPEPGLVRFLFAYGGWLIVLLNLMSLMLMFAAFIYIGGPRVVRWFQFRGLPFADWVAWRIPWKRKRLQRTFSAMLAVLLDGGVPEAAAVRLAGDCTVNEICRRRAASIVAALERGTKLDAAVRAFDDTGEFHWRLANATHARGGFLRALQGWHEALDAKAFQQEESAAHTITSGLVILNGVIVALIATAMFAMLIAIIESASL